MQKCVKEHELLEERLPIKNGQMLCRDTSLRYNIPMAHDDMQGT